MSCAKSTGSRKFFISKKLPVQLLFTKLMKHSQSRNIGRASLPDIFVDIERPEQIRVSFLDEKEETQELEADGLLARCILHEIDHLDGVLHVDYLSRIKRELILRKLSKLKPTLMAERAERHAS